MKKRTLRTVAQFGLITMAGLLVEGSAFAEQRAWEVSGKITGITGDPAAIIGYPVKVGDRFAVRNTFDPTLGMVETKTCEESGWIWNGLILETEFRMGRWSQVIVSLLLPGSNPPSYNNITWVYDDRGGTDQYGMYMEDWYGPPSNPRLSKLIVNWGIAKNSPSDMITSTAILDTPPHIRDYQPVDAAEFQLTLDNIGGETAFIRGRLDRLRDITHRK